MATINIDTRASGRKQGPKRERKTRENVDLVLPISSFLDIETTSVTSSSTSSVPISQTAIQQSNDSTSFPSILAQSNTSSAWNASFSSRQPQTQSQLNDLASHSSTNHLLYRGTDLQPQHQAFPLTREVSHVATAMGGAAKIILLDTQGSYNSHLRHPCLAKGCRQRCLLRNSIRLAICVHPTIRTPRFSFTTETHHS